MSYTKSLPCGCTVYVACWPQTGVAHTTIIESRGKTCGTRGHERGVKLWTAPRDGAPAVVRPWSASLENEGHRPRQIA